MASTDIRTSFAMLEDATTQAGLPLHKVLEGDAAAAKNASAGLVAVDPSDNLKYLEVNAAGQLSVTMDAGSLACLSDSGEDEDGDIAAFSDIATIVAQLEKTYLNFGWVGSCFRDTIFQVVHIDDVGIADTETIVAEFLVGPGNLTASQELSCLTFSTVGKTGVQNFVLRAKNTQKASAIRGTLAIHEAQ